MMNLNQKIQLKLCRGFHLQIIYMLEFNAWHAYLRLVFYSIVYSTLRIWTAYPQNIPQDSHKFRAAFKQGSSFVSGYPCEKFQGPANVRFTRDTADTVGPANFPHHANLLHCKLVALKTGNIIPSWGGISYSHLSDPIWG